jgi:hypothetical protein
MVRALLLLSLLCAWPALAETRRFVLALGNNAGAPAHAPLRYAEADAARFARTLVEVGGVKEDDVLLLQGRTLADAEAALHTVQVRIAAAHQAPDVRALLYVYFSGHGDGESLELGPGHLSFTQLRALLQGTEADVKVVILDACQSGGALRSKGGKAAAPFTLTLVDALKVSGDVFISSSTAEESSLESQELGGSVFTSHLLTGLRGAADVSQDQQVTLAEAYRYAYERTVRTTALSSQGTQHPAFGMKLAGQGELVLTQLEGAAVRLSVFPQAQRVLLVDVARDQVVVDLPATGARELALAPGRYAVKAVREGAVRVGQLELVAGTPAALTWESLHAESTPVLLGSRKGGPATSERVSLCVLPFVNAAGKNEASPLALGLAETIATDFGAQPALRLIERVQVDLNLQELEFSASKYVDPATREAIGHLAWAPRWCCWAPFSSRPTATASTPASCRSRRARFW